MEKRRRSSTEKGKKISSETVMLKQLRYPQLASKVDLSDAAIVINGHVVRLYHVQKINLLLMSKTSWLLVKFLKFVNFELHRILQKHGLDVLEHIGEWVYLCKFLPADRAPIKAMPEVTHMNIFPAYVKIGPEDAIPYSAEPRLTWTKRNDGVNEETFLFDLNLQPKPNRSLEDLKKLVSCTLNVTGSDSVKVDYGGQALRTVISSLSAKRKICKIDDIRSITSVRKYHPVIDQQNMGIGIDLNSPKHRYKGKGEIVFVADTGFDIGSSQDVHAAFTHRVLAVVNGPNSLNAADTFGHGTHIAGCVLGDFSNRTDSYRMQKGTAPESKLIVISLDFDRPHQYVHDILTLDVPPFGRPVIMNNSWGSPGNDGTWSYRPNEAQIVDRVMYADSDTCFIFAAGNDGQRQKPLVGGCAAAKNCITVGATYCVRPLDSTDVRLDRNGTIHSFFEVACFSNCGPVDGRIGVDVVAPGAVVESARSRAIDINQLRQMEALFGVSDHPDMLLGSGTSMSAAAVSGCIAVLRSVLRIERSITPTGALLKALLIHGTIDLAGSFFVASGQRIEMTRAPNSYQGYGLVSLTRSLSPILTEPCFTKGFLDGSLSDGQYPNLVPIEIAGHATKLVVTMAYTDLEGCKVQNILNPTVTLSDGRLVGPLQPTDPLNRDIRWTISNTAKIVVNFPCPGRAAINLSIETVRAEARFAIVWEVRTN